MLKINPYRPGAGVMPTFIAGREIEIEDANTMIEALTMNIPTQSVMYSGLRGVGKTVLINKIQKMAEEKGVFCKHIEVENRNDFISQMATCAQVFLREISTKEKLKNIVKKSLDSIKSLIISFDPNNSSFSLSVQDRELYQSSNLTQSLTDVFVSIGEAAYEAEIPICFFIDEIQYMKTEELGSLIAALHRTNQLGYPVMIVGAGLPKIYKMLSDEKTYSERLFVYKEIDSLDNEQSINAIIEPAKKFKVEYSKEAIDKIVGITKGYPFFIQQFCKIVYQNTDNRTIIVEDVERSIDEFFRTLDSGFFKVRYERCAESDKKFIFAMVECEELPCTISNIAKKMKRSVGSISTSRAQLINKGVVYSVRFKELDFTVPEFSGFIKRLDEYKEWQNDL